MAADRPCRIPGCGHPVRRHLLCQLCGISLAVAHPEVDPDGSPAPFALCASCRAHIARRHRASHGRQLVAVDEDEDLLTTAGAARVLGVSRDTIRRQARSGRLPAIRRRGRNAHGDRLAFRRTALVRLLDEPTSHTPPDSA